MMKLGGSHCRVQNQHCIHRISQVDQHPVIQVTPRGLTNIKRRLFPTRSHCQHVLSILYPHNYIHLLYQYTYWHSYTWKTRRQTITTWFCETHHKFISLMLKYTQRTRNCSGHAAFHVQVSDVYIYIYIWHEYSMNHESIISWKNKCRKQKMCWIEDTLQGTNTYPFTSRHFWSQWLSGSFPGAFGGISFLLPWEDLSFPSLIPSCSWATANLLQGRWLQSDGDLLESWGQPNRVVGGWSFPWNPR